MRLTRAIHRLAKRFRRAEDGNVAMIFGITTIPIMGLTGVAVDYSLAANVRSYMRAQADAAALHVAVAKAYNTATPDTSAMFAGMSATAKTKFGLTDLNFSGTWSDDNTRYTVSGTATVPNSLAAIVGLSTGKDTSTISLNPASTAEIRQPAPPPPAWKYLDPEAADYNRVYVYCFDKNRVAQADKGRRAMTAIADNAGTTYSYYMPVCKASETLSYRLYNVRNMRTTPSKWDNGQAERYNYYSDTTLNGTVPVYNFKDPSGNPVKILETVLCSSLAQCTPGGSSILPSGKNREPQQASAGCSEGKFLYFGWEDRPPGMGWTDKDYDDIRFTMECPKANPPPIVFLAK